VRGSQIQIQEGIFYHEEDHRNRTWVNEQNSGKKKNYGAGGSSTELSRAVENPPNIRMNTTRG